MSVTRFCRQFICATWYVRQHSLHNLVEDKKLRLLSSSAVGRRQLTVMVMLVMSQRLTVMTDEREMTGGGTTDIVCVGSTSIRDTYLSLLLNLKPTTTFNQPINEYVNEWWSVGRQKIIDEFPNKTWTLLAELHTRKIEARGSVETGGRVLGRSK